MKTWKDLVNEEMIQHNEYWNEVLYCQQEKDDFLSMESSQRIESTDLIIYTPRRIYFPAINEHNEHCITSISRFPPD